MISIYTSAFNLEKCKFDYSSSLVNFCNLVGYEGEVVIAVPNIPGDNTFELLLKWREKSKNLCENIFIYLCNFTPDDPQFDGKVKNHALQNCHPDNILIQMDLDEIIPLKQKQKWFDYAEFLNYQDEFQSFMIPILEPYGDISKIREDHGVKVKWRMHKQGLRRGVVDFAKKADGIHHDITLSDSTELIDNDGELVPSHQLVTQECYESLDNYLNFLKDNIYTVHLGYVSLDDRVLRNKVFWKKMWENECGEEVDVVLDKENLKYPTINHNLTW